MRDIENISLYRIKPSFCLTKKNQTFNNLLLRQIYLEILLFKTKKPFSKKPKGLEFTGSPNVFYFKLNYSRIAKHL